MKKSDIFPSNYVKAADIEGREVNVVIRECKIEELGTDRKLVIYFQNADKGLVCNVTNYDRIAYMYGDDTDRWGGKEIVLYTELATFQGKTGPAIRVKQPIKQVTTPQQQPQREQVFEERTGYSLSTTQAKRDDGLDRDLPPGF